MTDVVELAIHIEATPATVFRYFVDPERLVRWQGIEADIEPEPGGRMRIRINQGAVALGEYLEVVPDERLVFTWGWEGNDGVPPGSSTVEVTLTPEAGGTTVTLVHRDLPDAQAATDHGAGWTHYLARLQVAGPGGDPGPDALASGGS
ncbi:MAG: SRPBCC family protein [Actinomycetota bacterium]